LAAGVEVGGLDARCRRCDGEGERVVGFGNGALDGRGLCGGCWAADLSGWNGGFRARSCGLFSARVLGPGVFGFRLGVSLAGTTLGRGRGFASRRGRAGRVPFSAGGSGLGTGIGVVRQGEIGGRRCAGECGLGWCWR
jgi:hypothetical protein